MSPEWKNYYCSFPIWTVLGTDGTLRALKFWNFDLFHGRTHRTRKHWFGAIFLTVALVCVDTPLHPNSCIKGKDLHISPTRLQTPARTRRTPWITYGASHTVDSVAFSQGDLAHHFSRRLPLLETETYVGRGGAHDAVYGGVLG